MRIGLWNVNVQLYGDIQERSGAILRQYRFTFPGARQQNASTRRMGGKHRDTRRDYRDDSEGNSGAKVATRMKTG